MPRNNLDPARDAISGLFEASRKFHDAAGVMFNDLHELIERNESPDGEAIRQRMRVICEEIILLQGSIEKISRLCDLAK